MIVVTLLALASQAPEFDKASDAEICAAVTELIGSLNAGVASVEAAADRPMRSEPSDVDCSAKLIRLRAQSGFSGDEAREFVRGIEADPASECEGFEPLQPLFERGWSFEGFTRFADGSTHTQKFSCDGSGDKR